VGLTAFQGPMLRVRVSSATSGSRASGAGGRRLELYDLGSVSVLSEALAPSWVSRLAARGGAGPGRKWLRTRAARAISPRACHPRDRSRPRPYPNQTVAGAVSRGSRGLDGIRRVVLRGRLLVSAS